MESETSWSEALAGALILAAVMVGMTWVPIGQWKDRAGRSHSVYLGDRSFDTTPLDPPYFWDETTRGPIPGRSGE